MKAYLAGFEVFRKDAIEVGNMMKQQCNEYGIIGLFPLDNSVPNELNTYEKAIWITQQNMKMIQECDIVIANVNFFRGLEPDSGTAFEIGYATGIGKKVISYYSDNGDYIHRIKKAAKNFKNVKITNSRKSQKF